MYQYIAMCKYIIQIVQIITTLDEVLNHVLNMSWLKHFNSTWKVALMWFHKKNLDKVFHLNKHNYVEKTKLLKLYFCFKNNKNHVGGFCIKFHFTCFFKCSMKSMKNYPQNNTKCTPKKTFSCLKWPL
jgi:hypothetical protein